jgi:hypothetical protein
MRGAKMLGNFDRRLKLSNWLDFLTKTPLYLAELIVILYTIRVYILDPAALTTSLQALVSFWPYSDVGAGNVTYT